MTTILKRKRDEDISSGFKKLKINNLRYQNIDENIIEKFETKINTIENKTNIINDKLKEIEDKLKDMCEVIDKIYKFTELDKVKEYNCFSYIS